MEPSCQLHYSTCHLEKKCRTRSTHIIHTYIPRVQKMQSRIFQWYDYSYLRHGSMLYTYQPDLAHTIQNRALFTKRMRELRTNSHRTKTQDKSPKRYPAVKPTLRPPPNRVALQEKKNPRDHFPFVFSFFFPTNHEKEANTGARKNQTAATHTLISSVLFLHQSWPQPAGWVSGRFGNLTGRVGSDQEAFK